MGAIKIQKPVYSRQFTIVAVGPSRSETEVRKQVDEGGFFGAAAAWSWVFHALPDAKTAIDAVVLGGLGKAGGKLFEIFLEKLKAKNILPQAGPQSRAEADRALLAKKPKPTKKAAQKKAKTKVQPKQQKGSSSRKR
jgi:hypothetical protein